MLSSTPSRPVSPSSGAGLCLLLCCACACGGGATQRRADPVARQTPEGVEVGTGDSDRMDEIQRLCNRKAGITVPTCWNDEYMRTRKKFEAQVTLMLQVSPAGRAEDVKVVSSTAQSKELLECLVNEAKGWSYPEGKSPIFVNCSFFLRSSM